MWIWRSIVIPSMSPTGVISQAEKVGRQHVEAIPPYCSESIEEPETRSYFTCDTATPIYLAGYTHTLNAIPVLHPGPHDN